MAKPPRVIDVLNNSGWSPIWYATRYSIDVEMYAKIRYDTYTIPFIAWNPTLSDICMDLNKVLAND